MPCCSHQISGLVSLPSADCNLLAALVAADLMRLDNCVKARAPMFLHLMYFLLLHVGCP